ncbi:MAG: lamin tail domain-containing protein [Actinobacteria bacterium]|nr:lamin tail domain-containing protein [Actinomycetota bacterium]
MKIRAQLAIAAVLVAAVLAPTAAGSPAGDLSSVLRDYSRDEKITPCRFTQGQLESARSQISEDIEIYAKGVRGAIRREVKRWKNGGCKGRGAAANKLRIVAIDAAGGPRKESVTIRNTGRRTVRLRGFALRDAADHTLKFRSTKLAPGRRLKVVTGCRKGHRSAFRRGSRYYACRKNEVWDDAGDVVELLGRGGGLLAKKTY